MATIISGKKLFIPKPPDKGSFPLDHDSECKQFMVQYLKCLHNNDCDNSSCRPFAKQYLKCRMDRNLMAPEEWNQLGFHDNNDNDNKNNKNFSK
jgi:cytochrome c oxidase assembly protein subunit 19